MRKEMRDICLTPTFAILRQRPVDVRGVGQGLVGEPLPEGTTQVQGHKDRPRILVDDRPLSMGHRAVENKSVPTPHR